MQGKILDYSNDMKSGLIRGTDGNKYRFSIDDCKSSIKPRAGADVDFETSGDKATEIYVLTKDTIDDIKDTAKTAVRATADVTVKTSKKILPTVIFLGVIFSGIAIYINVIAPEIEHQKFEKLLSKYNDKREKIDNFIKEKNCLAAATEYQNSRQMSKELDDLIGIAPFGTLSPDNNYQITIAECYANENDFIKAVDLIDINVRSIEYLNRASEIYKKAGDDTKAIQASKQAATMLMY